jgi:spore coat protein JA
MSVSSPFKVYETYVGPCDPCPPVRVKAYSTAPDLYIPFQPMCLQQYNPFEALKVGTLWPAFYSPYEGRK